LSQQKVLMIAEALPSTRHSNGEPTNCFPVMKKREMLRRRVEPVVKMDRL
jgi:hypothetical protein